MSLASVESWMGAVSTGKTRDIAFLRAVFAWEKAVCQSDVQEKGVLRDVMSLSGFTKLARPGKNCL